MYELALLYAQLGRHEAGMLCFQRLEWYCWSFLLGGGFKDVLFLPPISGEMIHCDYTSLKLTAVLTVGILSRFQNWDGIFSGAVAVSFREGQIFQMGWWKNHQLDVSKNRGTPKWMGYPNFWNTQLDFVGCFFLASRSRIIGSNS